MCMLIKLLVIFLASVMIFAISLLTPSGHCVISGLGARTLQVYIAHPPIFYPIKHLGLFEPLTAYTPWSGFAIIVGAWLLAALLAWPKWPENMFQAFRKKIRIDNNA